MVTGTGIDVVEVSRIEATIERFGERFLGRVYSERERRYCEAKKKGSGRAFSARFAAKEAVAKALGVGIRRGVNFKDIEVVLDAIGKPSIALHGGAQQAAVDLGVTRVHIALSHEGELAVAFALSERL